MVMREVTDKRMEEMLYQTEENFKTIFDGNIDGILIVNPEDKKFFAGNKTICNMLGYSDGEIKKLGVADIHLKEDLPFCEKQFDRLVRKEIICAENTPMKRKDGSIFYADISSNFIVLSGKTYLMGSIRDVTERKRAEEFLKDSEVRFRELFEHMSSAVAVYEPENDGGDFVFKDCNQALLNIEKVNKEEIIGRRVTEVFPSVKEFGIFEVFKRVYSTGNAEHFPVGLYKDERISGWRENYIYKLPCGEIVAIYDDVTERKQAENKLEWLSSFPRLNPLPVLEVGQDGEIYYINPVTYHIFPDLEKKKFDHPFLAGIKSYFDNPHKEEVEYFSREMEVDSRWYSQIIILTDTNRIRVYSFDITERKRAEEAMRDSEVRYRRLFEAAQDGILILDAETGMIVDVNPFLVEMLGFPHEWFVGKAVWEIGLFKDIASNKDKFIELQRNEYVRYEDLPLETAAGKQIEVEFVSNVYTVDHSKVVQCNIRDITERKRLEREVKDHVEMKSRFISRASHELRSPLGVIKEGINLVLEGMAGSINNEQRDLLDTAKRNTDRLGRLINNVLDFQKIDSGKMEFNTLENDINEVVIEVDKTMSLLAKEKGLNLVAVTDNSIPRTDFDRDKIIQVLTNLVSNAIKYTNKGSITISTKQEDNAVHVIVQDTGVGIRAEDMQKLFQVFEQLDGGKKGGTGLGLAISKEIILSHKGKIWAESEPGKGSAFHFTIPMKLKEKKKIGEILVEVGKISEGDLKKALEKQEEQG